MIYLYKLSSKLVLAAAMLFFVSSDASAFLRTGRVTTTTSNTDTSDGDPIRATWGVVRDGTTVPSAFVPDGVPLVSDFIWRLDEIYNVAEEDRVDDITQRPWFSALEDAMETFSIRAGITYTYEPNDDGVPIVIQGNGGIAGVRPDLRISGIEFRPNTALAYTSSGSNHGEMVFNTVETQEWSINTLRGITIHENMHSVGFFHSVVNGRGGTTAMGFNSSGPQYDDLLGLHYNYGDSFEKSGGNDTLATATDLGAVNAGGTLELGLDVTAGDDYTTVGITASDFVSIDSNTDTDFYKFSVESGGDVVVKVMPRGTTYTWAISTSPLERIASIASKVHSDLSFKVFDASGAELFEVADAAIGIEESITTNLAAGDYYVQISGSSDIEARLRSDDVPTQFYSLEVTTAPAVSDQSLAVAQIGSQSINLGSDSALTYTVLSNPPNGTLSGTAPNLIYTPNTGFEGIDSFTFSASRDGLESAVATITLEVANFITLSRVSNSNGYDIPQAEAVAFRSTGVPKTFDADGDNAYGTAGLAIFSTVSGTGNSGFDTYLGGVPPWVSSITPGSDFVTTLRLSAFTDFDNPTAEISTEVVDLTVTGYARSASGAVGTWAELVNFTIEETAPTAIRIGVLAGNNGRSSVNLDPSGIRLSVNGSEPVEATSLDMSVGMVFFDLLLRSPITANFSLEAQRNGEDSLTAVAGITFDVIPPGFYTWALDFPEFSDVSVDSDPDNDGIVALIEYVLNGSPTGDDQAILPQANIENGNFVFDFHRLVSSSFDTVQVFQYSTSLEANDWTDIPITSANTGQVSLSSVADNDELEAVSITIDAATGNQQKLFGRLKVTLAE